MTRLENTQSTSGLTSKAHSSRKRRRALHAGLALAAVAACSFSPAGASAQVSLDDEEVAKLKALLEYIEVQDGTIDGLAGPHIIFEGANVHVRSGSGRTDDAGPLTGLGNLVVGYNEDSAWDGIETRTGSHNLVVGPEHSYSSYGGFIAGLDNTLSSDHSSIAGGYHNVASEGSSSVSGGQNNVASGEYSSVSGGQNNVASGYGSSVSGGHEQYATGEYASVSGDTGSSGSLLEGYVTVVTDEMDGLAGPHIIFEGANVHVRNGSGLTHARNGLGNLIVGYNEENAPGYENRTGSHNLVVGTRHSYSSVGGFVAGLNNTVSAPWSSVSGGRVNEASAPRSSVCGGSGNVASGIEASVSGGANNLASAQFSSVSGGVDNWADGWANWYAGSHHRSVLQNGWLPENPTMP